MNLAKQNKKKKKQLKQFTWKKEMDKSSKIQL